MITKLAGTTPFELGEGAFQGLADHVVALGHGGNVLLVCDPFWADSETLSAMLDRLPAHVLFSDFAGEPKAAHIREAAAIGKDADAAVVVGIGGGSALDIAKLAAACAPLGLNPEDYAFAKVPFPTRGLPLILVPTTAGTGSEANGTSVFSDASGRKLWAYDEALRADLAILDPRLTASLPANLTAWCGMDALVHAFEASTSRWTNPVAQLYSHHALRLVTGALERAVSSPQDMEARAEMLLGSFYAGFAIDNCGTAVAHNISHSLATLGPVHHGLATALGFEASLPFVVSSGTSDVEAAARACGVDAARDLPDRITKLMDAIGIERRLPDTFGGADGARLSEIMKMPENASMRGSTVPELTDTDVDRIARDVMALA